MKKIILTVFGLVVIAGPAQAACPGTIPALRIDPASGLRAPTNCVYNASLVSSTSEAITIPTDALTNKKAKYVIFSPESDGCANFSVDFNKTAVANDSDLTDGTASFQNPIGFDLSIGNYTSINLISADSDCDLRLEFYSQGF